MTTSISGGVYRRWRWYGRVGNNGVRRRPQTPPGKAPLIRVIDETVDLSETRYSPRVLARILSEVVNINETVLNPRVLVRVLSEAINVNEVIVRLMAMTRVVDEVMNISEDIVRILGALPGDIFFLAQVLRRHGNSRLRR